MTDLAGARKPAHQASATEPISPMTRALSEHIATALERPLPPEVEEKARHHLLDTLAAMVSGSRLLPGRRAIAYVRAQGGARQATVVGSRHVSTAVNAALANGMSAHADETDDSHARSLTHPGCGVVPAALAMAERNRRSGQELLRAVALGYDICARLSLSLGAYDFRDAGHSTHSFGPTFGAAAAAGTLSGLDKNQVRHLLSYTAQQVSGVACWMRDAEHVEKAFDFGGMPARNGTAAASMVAAGFSAVDDVFSGERNFYVAYGALGDPALLGQDLGRVYEIMNTNIKRWSVGSPIQAPLDSLLELIRTHSIRAEDVEQVEVRVSITGANTTDNRHMPDICMQHMVACMLLDGIVTFESSHDDARMQDPKVQALRKKVTLIGDEALQKVMPSRQGIVTLRLSDGRTLRHHTEAVRGTAENPMKRAEVDEKCYHLLVPVLGKSRSRKLVDAVWGLETVKDVRSLRSLLRA
jgi:2-methylcitrate dehydratase PrpD